jgi:hypothetical protein
LGLDVPEAVGQCDRECRVDQGARDAAMFVVWFDDDLAQVDRVVEGTPTLRRRERHALGDNPAPVLDNVEVALVVAQGFEQFLAVGDALFT